MEGKESQQSLGRCSKGQRPGKARAGVFPFPGGLVCLLGLCVLSMCLLKEGRQGLVSGSSQTLGDGCCSPHFMGEEVGSEAFIHLSVPHS